MEDNYKLLIGLIEYQLSKVKLAKLLAKYNNKLLSKNYNLRATKKLLKRELNKIKKYIKRNGGNLNGLL